MKDIMRTEVRKDSVHVHLCLSDEPYNFFSVDVDSCGITLRLTKDFGEDSKNFERVISWAEAQDMAIEAEKRDNWLEEQCNSNPSTQK